MEIKLNFRIDKKELFKIDEGEKILSFDKSGKVILLERLPEPHSYEFRDDAETYYDIDFITLWCEAPKIIADSWLREEINNFISDLCISDSLLMDKMLKTANRYIELKIEE